MLDVIPTPPPIRDARVLDNGTTSFEEWYAQALADAEG